MEKYECKKDDTSQRCKKKERMVGFLMCRKPMAGFAVEEGATYMLGTPGAAKQFSGQELVKDFFEHRQLPMPQLPHSGFALTYGWSHLFDPTNARPLVYQTVYQPKPDSEGNSEWPEFYLKFGKANIVFQVRFSGIGSDTKDFYGIQPYGDEKSMKGDWIFAIGTIRSSFPVEGGSGRDELIQRDG